MTTPKRDSNPTDSSTKTPHARRGIFCYQLTNATGNEEPPLPSTPAADA